MDGDQESAGSNFIVGFLTVDGKPLTVIGPPDALAALESRLKDAAAADIELHHLDRPTERDHPTD